MLAAVSFASTDVSCCRITDLKTAQLADFDGDDDQDILLLGDSRTISWLENDGATIAGPKRVDQLADLRDAIAADVDGDGWVDIVAATRDHLFWYRNHGAAGEFLEPVRWPSKLNGNISEMHVGDFNSDGRPDLLLRSGRTMAVRLNVEGASYASAIPLPGETRVSPEIVVADLDGDQKSEVVVTTSTESGRNLNIYQFDGQDFEIQRSLGQQFDNVAVADLDGDGDVDIIGRRDSEIVWVPNKGNLDFEAERQLVSGVDHGHSIQVLDAESDGDNDVSIMASQQHLLLRNDGTQHYTVESFGTLGNGLISHLVTDLFGDESVDSVYFENGRGVKLTHDIFSLENQPVILFGELRQMANMASADIDDDGLIDVAVAHLDGVRLFLNRQSNWEAIDVYTRNGSSEPQVQLGDLDGDGRTDLVHAHSRGTIRWFRNIGGPSFFDAPIEIGRNFNVLSGIRLVDLDADEDVDIVLAARGVSGSVSVLRNSGGGVFGPATQFASCPVSCRLADANKVEADRSIDLVFETESINAEIYLQSLNADGTSETKLIGRGEAPSLADVDGDGDFDLVSILDGLIELRVWEEGKFNSPIAVAFVEGVRRLTLVDIDLDGDIDIIAADWTSHRLWLIERFANEFSQPIVVSNSLSRGYTMPIDIESDGDIDLVGIGLTDSRLVLLENRLPGDANDDGVFDSSDLVQVFSTGHYEDSIRWNSSFEDGDWNGDGEFTSSDLVFAFQAGTYVQAANGLRKRGFT